MIDKIKRVRIVLDYYQTILQDFDLVLPHPPVNFSLFSKPE
jgi:hypothetical protein